MAIFYDITQHEGFWAVKEVSFIVPGKGKAFTLAELQRLIGGYIEVLYLPNKHMALFDEDGIRKGLPLNFAASRTVGSQLRGPVLIINATEMGDDNDN